jgi:uncharacterized protein GlcG (DUF336 family)
MKDGLGEAAAGHHTRFAALRLGGATLGAAIGASLGGAGGAQAQAGPPAQSAPPAQASAPASVAKPGISLAGAQAAIAAAESKAREIGVPMAICVVDESGVLKAFARMDGNSLASVALVQAKAFTAAAFRTPTHVLAERNAADPTRVASLPNFPNVTFLGGGYPIMVGGAVVGGLGAGGGSAQQDMEVAEAAVAAIS